MSRWFPNPTVIRLGDADDAGQGVAAVSLAESANPSQDRVDALLATFEAALDARPADRGARITCIVGGECVRYGLVPWSPTLSSAAQRQVLAEQCFAEAYGAAARDWTVRDHAVRYGAATLACAVDTQLLDRLDAAARSRGVRLISVQPSLMTAFNQHMADRRTPAIPAGLLWFVWLEVRRTTLLLLAPREPLQVKQLLRSGGDLGRTLDREWFALGLDSPRCPVYVARAPSVHAASSEPLLMSGWPVTELGA